MDSAAAAGAVPVALPHPRAHETGPLWPRFGWGLAALLLSLVSFLFVDHALAGYLKAHRYKGELSNLLQAAEHFGTPYGAALILITLWIVLPETRRRISRTAAGAIAAGLVADIGKLLVTRLRPDTFDFAQPIQASITGFLKFGQGGSRHQSFPSAHTAFAFAFAVMLGDLFPRGRVWFLCIAALVALQRVFATAHYPSDVFAGAAVGWIVASIFLGPSALSRFYDRMEERYFPRSSEHSVTTSYSTPR